MQGTEELVWSSDSEVEPVKEPPPVEEAPPMVIQTKPNNTGMGSYIQILGTPQRACDPQRA